VETFDLAVVGGGVIGAATVRACLQKHRGLKACLIEREPELARHQSGRNSGVVHVGYNQKPGTVKARFVVEGSRRLRQYCREHNVALVEDGILIVAKDEREVAVLKELKKRGDGNGARVEIVDAERLHELEPQAAGIAALLAPDGSSFDSRGYVLSLAEAGRELGATFFLSEAVQDLKENGNGVEIQTSTRTIRAKVLVCAAGLYADRLAHKLGMGLKYQMVPFRGEYHELIPERRDLVRAHIYPAPDLHFPFLGVHLSRTFDGRVLVGPGAVLALGRESYDKSQINLSDIFEMARRKGFWKLFLSKEFRDVARQEWKKSLFAQAVLAEAQQLLPALRNGDLVPSRAGIRAQLVSQDGQLVEDLTVEESDRTIHVLNAVSPALTCSLPFADHLSELVDKRL
jgi:L-2-hydroxyglutarate oxidase